MSEPARNHGWGVHAFGACLPGCPWCELDEAARLICWRCGHEPMECDCAAPDLRPRLEIVDPAELVELLPPVDYEPPPRPRWSAPDWWNRPGWAIPVLLAGNLIFWTVIIAAGYGFLELARWCAVHVP